MSAFRFLPSVLPAMVCVVLGFSACAPQAPPPPPPPPPTPVKMPPKPLHLVGQYPLPGMAVQDHFVLYFDQPVAVPAEGAVIDPESVVKLSPAPLKPEVTLKDNWLKVNIAGLSGMKQLAFVEAEIQPGLVSAEGGAFDAAQGRLALPTGTDPAFTVRETTLENDRLAFKMELPWRWALFSKFYLVEVLESGGAPATGAEWIDAEPTDSFVSLSLPRTTPFPCKVRLTRNMDDAGPFPLRKDLEFSLPQGEPMTVQNVRWRKNLLGLEVLEVRFTGPVETAAAAAKTSITDASGAPVKHECVTDAGYSPVIRFKLDNDAVKDASTVNVGVDAPLAGAENALMLASFNDAVQREAQEQLGNGREGQQPTAIEANWSYWNENGLDGVNYVMNFNTALTAEALRKALTVKPPVENLTVEVSDGRRVVVKGDFRHGMDYTFEIAAGVRSSDGKATLDSPLIYTPDKPPRVVAAGLEITDRFYIPKKSLGPVRLLARNTDKVTVRLSRLFPSNIAQAVNDMNDGHPWGTEFDDQFTEVLTSEDVSFPGTPDTLQTRPLDVVRMLPQDRRGVFTFVTTPSDRNTMQIVLWTDLGMVAHWQDDELAVFVHDINTLAPVANATVTVHSGKSQVMATLQTDGQGMAHFAALDKRFGAPRVVVAETKNDASFLSLDAREEDEAPFKENMPRFDPEGYDAYLYLDRNLYRPGETMHARWIVRTKTTEAAANVPLLFQVQNPKNRLLKSEPVTLSELGTGGIELASEKSWLTGKYTVELRVPGADAPIGTAFFNVEEFVPNRMKAEITADRDRWTPGDPVAIRLKAENLYGGPAANRRGEALIILRPGEFSSEKWKGYSFRNDTALEPMLEKLGTRQTDAEGLASFTYTYKQRDNVTMPLAASLRGMVFELGGREVRARASATVFPAPVALGVALAPVPGARAVDVSVAAIRPDESPAALAGVKVTLEKEEWNYHVRSFSGRYEPRWTKSFVPLETREVALAEGRGRTRFEFSDEGWGGRRRVRVHSDQTPMFSTGRFNLSWDRVEVFDSGSPTLIELALNKERFEFGEDCELRIRSPFDGTAFVVLQGDKFVQRHTVPVAKGEGLLRFTAEPEHFPNVWAEVTVVRPVELAQNQVYPFSSFAMINIPLNDPAKRVAVAFPDLPEEVRPAQRVEFTVETRDSAGNPVAAEVTLAAVDEGIHSILDYANPDPFTWFQRSRQPDFRRAHYYDKIAYDFTPAQIGGDAIERRLGGAPQVGENWIRPVALWSGAVRTDAAGRAVVSFDVPEFNGRLRLVSVAATQGTTGAAAAGLYVRRPYILQAGMPRFALPGDLFGCTASVINTTQTPVRAVLRWKTTGGLTGLGEQALEVAAGATASHRADLAATAAGPGSLVWEAEIINPADGAVLERLAQDAPIPVRAPAAWQSATEQQIVQPGGTARFQNSLFVDDGTVELSLSVSANPLMRLEKGLAYLLNYPHGCVEQTTSQVMPLYLLRKNAAMFGPSVMKVIGDASEQGIRSRIQAGVNRLFSMQTPEGGLGYWPGDTSPYPYGSVYAAHFITLVRRDNAATVPEKAFRSLQDYLRSVLNGGTAWVKGGYSGADLHLRAYACHVLALDGQADAVAAISRFDTLDMPPAGRWLLAAALAVNTGDAQRVADYLKTMRMSEGDGDMDDGVLNSETRNTAVRLMAGSQMKLPQARLQPMADRLMGWLMEAQRLTTQDTAFVLAALGEYLGALNTDLRTAQVRVIGPEGEKILTGSDRFAGTATGPGAVFTVVNEGKIPAVANFVSAGVPLAPRTEPLSEGLAVARTICDDKGAPLAADAPLAHGSGYLVDLTISTPRDKPLRNVVLSDLLPAGLEVSNPRLDADALAAMGKGAAASANGQDGNGDGPGGEYEGDGEEAGEGGDDGASRNKGLNPSFLEVRDDRLVLAFDTIPPGTHHFYYAVRAVTPGNFRHPAVGAECMYNPEVRAANVDGTVVVE